MASINKITVGGVIYDITIPAGLSEAEQAQIRENIGAISASESGVVVDGTYPQMTVGAAEQATNDENGDNISKTYVKKSDFDLLILENEYPVGGRPYIQFPGTQTPAERWAGTSWEIDTTYQGRAIIGSGGEYTFGATGGSATQTHTLIGSAKIGLGNDYLGLRGNGRGETFQTESVVGVTIVSSYRDGVTGVDVTGSTSSDSIMQPYVVVNVWKRTA